jgi:hypothetical protein
MSYNPPRNDERVAIALEVRWFKSREYKAYTGDVSVGGCFIESLAPVTVGEQFLFEIRLPTGRWQLLGGEVVYHIPDAGFGIRYGHLPNLLKDLLAELIEYARGE